MEVFIKGEINVIVFFDLLNGNCLSSITAQNELEKPAILNESPRQNGIGYE